MMRKLPFILCCACGPAESMFAASGKACDIAAKGGGVSFVLAIICLVALCKIGWCAIAALYAVLFPRRTLQGSHLLVRKTHTCAAVGVLLVVFLALLVKILFDFTTPAVYLSAAFVAAMLFCFFCVGGFAMMGHAIGERMQLGMGSPTLGSNLHATLRGGAVLILVDLLPLFGSLIMLCALVTGAGASVITLFSQPRSFAE